ncbi:MAG: glutathione peroxidase [Gammaproteobacteria bacterium]|nr:glutathione peroxidase [Gammaproteobacteria bacterium]
MKRLIIFFTFWLWPLVSSSCPVTLDFEMRKLAGDEKIRLCEAYQNKVVLIVNTASKCGYTYQYEGLETLYDKYHDEGFVVLGFPSNDFAGQEPGSEHEIRKFCRNTYSIEFPMFEKIRVREGVADPLYAELASQAGEFPRWNFHKYLLDRSGKLVGSFSSRVEPENEKLISAIEQRL